MSKCDGVFVRYVNKSTARKFKNSEPKTVTEIGMNRELVGTLDAVETDGVVKVEGILRTRLLLLGTKKMRQGEQRLLQCVGEVHEL